LHLLGGYLITVLVNSPDEWTGIARTGTTHRLCYSSGVNERWLRGGTWALALAYLWWLLAWSVRPEHFFFADDWDWLYRAVLLPFQFTPFPQFVMNDRPVGALVYRILYGAFGLRPAPFHWLVLGLHLVNTTLVLLLGRRLLRSYWLAAAAALTYGGWSAAIEAASWMAAIFDVLAKTLVLLTALAFTSRRWPVRLASVIFFYLALRTKESAIVTLGLLVAITLVSRPRKEWLRLLWPHAALAAAFVIVYVPLLAHHQSVETAANPYRMDFTPRTFFEGLYDYTSIMLYGRPWPVGRLIRWLCVAGLVAAGVATRSRATLVGIAGYVLFLLPVIFMAHQRQALYLYVPATFFVLALAGGAEAVTRGREALAAAIMLLCVVALPHRAKMQARANWILSHTIRAKADVGAFRSRVPSLRNGARVALIGFPEDYHVFQTPGCSVLKVYYRVDPVSCEPATSGAGGDVAVQWHPQGIEVTAGGK
jgi:hypothetical protein